MFRRLRDGPSLQCNANPSKIQPKSILYSNTSSNYPSESLPCNGSTGPFKFVSTPPYNVSTSLPKLSVNLPIMGPPHHQTYYK